MEGVLRVMLDIGPKGKDVVQHYPGTGSTDFWGISFAFSSIDRQDLPREELDRELTLMQACWAFFDGVRGRVSAQLRKGPRGGGRDRDQKGTPSPRSALWVTASLRERRTSTASSPGNQRCEPMVQTLRNPVEWRRSC